MPSNITNLEGYTVFSSMSLAGSGSSTLGTNVSVTSWALSILTAPNVGAIPSGYLAIVQQASGFSLIYKSGTTSYTVGASAVSA